jgi:large subunit ribosomal protein L2
MLSSRKLLSKKKPEKKLLLFLKKKAGRNSAGRITVRHRGGGVKRLYRVIDFGQEKLDVKGKVLALEYDPNRTAFIALISYEDNDKRYVLAPVGLKKNDKVICSDKAEIEVGNRMRLENIPPGTGVYNIELEPGRGGKIVRSAGTSSQILVHEGRYSHLKMPSGEVRKIFKDCFASVGQISNPKKRFDMEEDQEGVRLE